MNLFQLGDFTLNSGVKSAWRIDCDALDEDDITTLAQIIRQMVCGFRSVEGIPRGGLRLAAALQPYVSIAGTDLIVDDVLTSGGSMERARDAIYLRDQVNATQCPHYVTGVVLFARGQCPWWVVPLFQLPESLWVTAKYRG